MVNAIVSHSRRACSGETAAHYPSMSGCLLSSNSFHKGKSKYCLESFRQATAFSDSENERPRERLKKQNTTETIS